VVLRCFWHPLDPALASRRQPSAAGPLTGFRIAVAAVLLLISLLGLFGTSSTLRGDGYSGDGISDAAAENADIAYEWALALDGPAIFCSVEYIYSASPDDVTIGHGGLDS
jgi:hypothetical protein